MCNVFFLSLKHFWQDIEHPIIGRTLSLNHYKRIARSVNTNWRISSYWLKNARSFCQWMWPFVSDTDRTDHKIHKIDQVLNCILENCTDVHNPGKFLSMDEGMVLFRRRLSFQPYIKNNTYNYEIKLYELWTSEGYILNIINLWKERNITTPKERVCLWDCHDAQENFIGKGDTAFLDNFYNRVDLAKNMSKNQLNTCGTPRSHKTGCSSDKVKKGVNLSAVKKAT